MTQLNKLLEYAYKCDRKKGEWLTIRMQNSNRTFTSRSPRYLYMGHHLGTWQEDARLYESWRCIMKRKEMPYEETRILNAALPNHSQNFLIPYLYPFCVFGFCTESKNSCKLNSTHPHLLYLVWYINIAKKPTNRKVCPEVALSKVLLPQSRMVFGVYEYSLIRQMRNR